MKDSRGNDSVEMQKHSRAPTGLQIEELEAALTEVRIRVQDTEQKITELRRVNAAAEEEARLLERLIALRRDESDSGSSGRLKATAPKKKPVKGSSHKILPGTYVVGVTLDTLSPQAEVINETLLILQEAEHPLPISEIMRLLAERRVRIPGAGTQANLISHLRRDGKIVRPSRGVYALADWGYEEMTYSKKPRRRKKGGRVTKR